MTNGQSTGILSPLRNALQVAIPTRARGRSIGHEQQDTVWHTERASMSNQQDPDTRKNRHEQREQHESSLSAFLGTEPAQRQVLAAQFVQQWLQEAEQLVAQRHLQRALEVYALMLVVDPIRPQALQGLAQVY